MSPRIAPAEPPFSEYAQEVFSRLMPPGVPPLTLFTTLARDSRLFSRFMGGGLLDRGHLTIREREIVIDRVTARAGSEYEWGVHTTMFAAKAELTEAQIESLVHGGSDDPCWTTLQDRTLVRICDALAATCSIDDALWSQARGSFTEIALLEVVMLAGFYRMVSCLTNVLALQPEPYAARFPAATAASARGPERAEP
jgi:alkylhydroperoxidase family enzyme